MQLIDGIQQNYPSQHPLFRCSFSSSHYKTLKRTFFAFVLCSRLTSTHRSRGNFARQSSSGRYRLNKHVYSPVKRSFLALASFFAFLTLTGWSMLFCVHCYVNGHSRISEFELILSYQGRNVILVHGYVKQKQPKRNAKHV